MKSKNLLLVILATIFMVGCEKSEFDLERGEGTLTIDDVSYSLNMLTMSTFERDNGEYYHNAIITDVDNGNVAVSITVTDELSENTIQAGEYETTLNGKCTVRISVDNGNEDNLEGFLRVTHDKEKYNFSFTGQTIDENSPKRDVSLKYSGVQNQ